MHDPAKQWERFGREDPYYGVFSVDEMRRERLDAAAKDRFFESGETDVARALASARRVKGDDFDPRVVLDHGCGVGRLVVPFAAGAERVVGVDVSASMLAEARRNCDARGLTNVELVTADRLASLAPEFDLVNSYIVLQHIPPAQGLPIVRQLASLVRPGGVMVLHVPTAARDRRTRLHTWVTRKVPFAYNVMNVARRRPWSYPHMQMNVYPLNRLALLLTGLGYDRMTLELGSFPDGIDYAACIVVVERPA